FCDHGFEGIGTTGLIQVKKLTFDFFGGLISDVDLMEGINQAIGLIPDKNPLGRFAKAVATRLAPVAVGQLLDFEVSSQAAGGSEKASGAPPINMDSVISVTDSLSLTAPFFKGAVTALSPGLSAVQATLDLEQWCLGKASGSIVVWVAPKIERVQIRNS